VVKTLSKDRKYVYLMCLAMVTGEFKPARLPYWRCGRLHSARWLTMAGRALRLRASQPFAHAYELETLERLCVFIVGVYYKVCDTYAHFLNYYLELLGFLNIE